MKRLLKYHMKKFLFMLLMGLVFALIGVGSYVEFIEGISVFAVDKNASSGLALTETIFSDNGFLTLNPGYIITLLLIFYWKNKETNGRVGEFLATLPLKRGAKDILDYIMMSAIIVISTMASLLHMLFVQNKYNKTIIREGNKAGIDADFIASENKRLVMAYMLFLLFLLALFSFMYIITISTKNGVFAMVINLAMIYMLSFGEKYQIFEYLDENIDIKTAAHITWHSLLLLFLAGVLLNILIARTKELSRGKFFYNIYGEIIFSVLAGSAGLFFLHEICFIVFSVIAFIFVHPFNKKEKKILEVD